MDDLLSKKQSVNFFVKKKKKNLWQISRKWEAKILNTVSQ